VPCLLQGTSLSIQRWGWGVAKRKGRSYQVGGCICVLVQLSYSDCLASSELGVVELWDCCLVLVPCIKVLPVG
jgi:hypothetical protein